MLLAKSTAATKSLAGHLAVCSIWSRRRIPLGRLPVLLGSSPAWCIDQVCGRSYPDLVWDLKRHCQLDALYPERTGWGKLGRCRQTSPPTPDTASRPRSSSCPFSIALDVTMRPEPGGLVGVVQTRVTPKREIPLLSKLYWDGEISPGNWLQSEGTRDVKEYDLSVVR